MTVIAVAGFVGWLFILGFAIAFGSAAAKRGDRLHRSTRRYLAVSHAGAQVIPFDRVLAARRRTARSGVPRADPVQ
jgi:hypothetical protein